MKKTSNPRVLSLFHLVMINIIAIDSIHNLPMTAEYGLSLIFYYLLAGLCFFIPSALVSAELATAWPERGGIYIWVREAFGRRSAFVTIWLQWVYNLFWYPTILALIAGTVAYCIDPKLDSSRWYMLITTILLFWTITWINLRGMETSGLLSNISAIVGTLIPMITMIALAVIWVSSGHTTQITFSAKALLPDISSSHNLAFFNSVIFSVIGIEMSATHASEVKNPQRSYPRALLYSTIIILAGLIFSSLAIAMVVPAKQLNLITGALQAFQPFLNAFHLHALMPILALMIVCGAIGGVGAWIIGPTKGLLVASQDGSIPSLFSKINRKNVPVVLLLTQGILFTLLCSLFLLMPSVNSGFWIMSDIASILALLSYLFMFAAAITLRYRQPNIKRYFSVPGGKTGMWLVAGLGFITSLLTLAISFIPPAQIAVGNTTKYETILIIGVIIGLVLPLWIYRQSRID
ncbi:MAG: amino acid permease [Gammaproteobacteria bacterium]|nr:amino acid permease [Gammaproteobacteria bacterium]